MTSKNKETARRILKNKYGHEVSVLKKGKPHNNNKEVYIGICKQCGCIVYAYKKNGKVVTSNQMCQMLMKVL